MKEKQTVSVLRAHGKKDSRRTSVLLRTGSAFCMAAGITGLFFAMAGIPVRLLPLGLAVVSAAVVSVLDQAAEGRSYGGVLGLLVAAGVFFLSVSSVIRGIRGWGDRVLGMWNQVFGTFYEVYGTTEISGTDLERAGMVLALLASVLVWELVKRQSRAGLTLAVYVPFCLGLLLTVQMPLWIPALLAAGWLAAWCCGSGQSGGRWGICVLAAGMGALLCVVPAAGGQKQWEKTARSFRSQIRQGIEKVRFGEDSLPKGDLLQAYRMCAGTEERLELRLEGTCTLYLRGFVGAEYEENAWKALPADCYGGEYAGMLSWLERQGFSAGMQYAEHQSVFPEPDKDESTIQVSVKNTGASRRYVYLPETVAVCPKTHGSWKQDWSMEASGWFGADAYSFEFYGTQENAEIQIPEEETDRSGLELEETERFLQAERVYRSFVYDHYLDLDEAQKELLHGVFFQGDDWEEDSGLYTVTSRIRTVLRLLAAYEKTPIQVPADRDFPGWFLQDGKEGNAAYFASTAVLAYRAAGIPARYAEGYLLTKEQAKASEGETILLTEQNAHAWAEVYVDGLGWRTMEVTPGFYEELYEAEVIVAVPREDLEGGNSEIAGLPPSEEYELPKEQKEHAEELPSKERRNMLSSLMLIFVILFLLGGIYFRLREIYRIIRYRKMTGRERMFFLYGEIMKSMCRLYPDFQPGQPLKFSEKSAAFDRALYERTVRRMEKMIYGQMEPKPREILAAKALAAKLRAVLRRR